MSLRIGLTFCSQQSHLCSQLLQERWTQCSTPAKNNSNKNKTSQKSRQNSVLLKQAQAVWRGIGTRRLMLSWCRSGGQVRGLLLLVPAPPACGFEDLLLEVGLWVPFPWVLEVFTFFFFLCLLGLLSYIYSPKILPTGPGNFAKVSTPYLGQDTWTCNMNSEMKAAEVEVWFSTEETSPFQPEPPSSSNSPKWPTERERERQPQCIL